MNHISTWSVFTITIGGLLLFLIKRPKDTTLDIHRTTQSKDSLIIPTKNIDQSYLAGDKHSIDERDNATFSNRNNNPFSNPHYPDISVVVENFQNRGFSENRLLQTASVLLEIYSLVREVESQQVSTVDSGESYFLLKIEPLPKSELNDFQEKINTVITDKISDEKFAQELHNSVISNLPYLGAVISGNKIELLYQEKPLDTANSFTVKASIFDDEYTNPFDGSPEPKMFRMYVPDLMPSRWQHLVTSSKFQENNKK